MLYADKSDLDRKVDLNWMKPGDVLLMHVKEIGIEILVGFSFNENRLDWAKDHTLLTFLKKSINF